MFQKFPSLPGWVERTSQTVILRTYRIGADTWQGQQRWADATGCLERLWRLEPDDTVVKLSLAKLLLEASLVTGALRRKKDRSGDLLSAIRCERIQIYEDPGQHRGARSELEKLDAEVPDYGDVTARLGL